MGALRFPPYDCLDHKQVTRFALDGQMRVLWRDVVTSPKFQYTTALLVAAAGGAAVTYVSWRAGIWWSAVLVVGLAVFLTFVLAKDKERVLFLSLVASLPLQIDFRLSDVPPRTGGVPATIVISQTDLLLVALLLVGMMNIVLGRRRLPRVTGMDLVQVVLIVVSGCSILNAQYPTLSAFELIRMVKGLILFFYVRHYVRRRQDVRDVVICLLLGVLFQGLLALVQYQAQGLLSIRVLGEGHKVETVALDGVGAFRSAGTLGSANSLARYLELLLPLALALLFARSGRLLTGLGIAAFLWGGLAMILTYSRGGWVALSLGIVLVMMNHMRRRVKWRSRVLALVFLISILGALFLTFGEQVSARLFRSSPTALRSRESLLIAAWEMIRAHPLLGIGLNNFVERLPEFDVVGISAVWMAPVHNEFVLVAAETGALGFAAFVAVMGTLVWRAWRTWMRSEGAESWLACGLLAGFVAFLAHGMIGWAYRMEVLYRLFWFLAGFLWALPKVWTRESTEHRYERPFVGQGAAR
jgi:hypothetical protein